jgi:hypothetical protein
MISALFTLSDLSQVGERSLILETEKCRAHTAQVFDPNKLCENCQINATFIVPPSDLINESNESEVDEQIAAGPNTETWRPRPNIRKCPFDSCGKQFKSRKGLLRHFELRKFVFS